MNRLADKMKELDGLKSMVGDIKIDMSSSTDEEKIQAKKIFAKFKLYMKSGKPEQAIKYLTHLKNEYSTAGK